MKRPETPFGMGSMEWKGEAGMGPPAPSGGGLEGRDKPLHSHTQAPEPLRTSRPRRGSRQAAIPDPPPPARHALRGGEEGYRGEQRAVRVRLDEAQRIENERGKLPSGRLTDGRGGSARTCGQGFGVRG